MQEVGKHSEASTCYLHCHTCLPFIPDGAGIQDRLLGHEGHLPPDPLVVVAPDVPLVKQHLPGLDRGKG